MTEKNEEQWGDVFGKIGALNAMMGLVGAGASLLSKRAKNLPRTKAQKANDLAKRIDSLAEWLENSFTSADCLIGTEAQNTSAPWNAEVNALKGEVAILRRRALLASAKLHAYSFPSVKKDVETATETLTKYEKEIADVLAMPDLSPEAEAAQIQLEDDQGLVVQVLSLSKLGFTRSRPAPTVEKLVADEDLKFGGLTPERIRVAVSALVSAGKARFAEDMTVWLTDEEKK